MLAINNLDNIYSFIIISLFSIYYIELHIPRAEAQPLGAMTQYQPEKGDNSFIIIMDHTSNTKLQIVTCIK